jgi:CDP-diacylglycerol--serine O-phosphatidyltransferase
VVFAFDGEPLAWWPFSAVWLVLLVVLGLLMVSTWRYYSFKGIGLGTPYTPLIIIVFGGFIYLTWNWPKPVLLALPAAYVASGIITRIAGVIRRRMRHLPPPATAPGAAR